MGTLLDKGFFLLKSVFFLCLLQILALQQARREAEVEADRLAREKKREAERERQKIKGQIEMEQERQREREALRLVRQQEAQERKWRERKLASERARAQREEEIRQGGGGWGETKGVLFLNAFFLFPRLIREEQIRQKRVEAARAMHREREFWEQATQKWKEDNQKEEEKGAVVAKARKTWFLPASLFTT